MRDADVRKAVRTLLQGQHAAETDTRVVEEMGVWAGSVRIDIAVINGELAGFELKSDRDTLQRLPLQADIYSRVFDRLTLVVGARHTAKAIPLIPDWWSVVEAKTDGAAVALETVRPGMRNPCPDPLLLAQLLWRSEAIAVLEAHGLAKGWRAKNASQIHRRLAAELSKEVLSECVRDALKRRVDWLRQGGPNQLDVAVHA